MRIIDAAMQLRAAMLNSGIQPTSISTMRVTMPAFVFEVLQRAIAEEAGRTVGDDEFALAGLTFVREPKP